MRKTREILRLRLGQKLPLRTVAQSCCCSPSRVHGVVALATEAGLTWPLPAELSEAELELKLYPKTPNKRTVRAEPDFRSVHVELGKKGVTLALLWHEYRESNPSGYGYSSFCDKYRTWRSSLDVSMRQSHAPGEKLFVDFAGQTAQVHDPVTGEVTEAQIFVAAMGLSQLTYAEAVSGQDVRNWASCHSNTYAFLGGVPSIAVPDNLKSAVIKPCKYEPELNRTYKDLADHYDTIILPARVRKPKDKAKAENAVQQVERWVLAPLRNQKFFSLAELNVAIRERLQWLNERPMKVIEWSRRQLFEEHDKSALKPLPVGPFRIPEWKLNAGVNIDYHVEFEGHYYSVPYTLVRKKVDLRITSRTVECLYQGKRVAVHSRSFVRGQHSTIPEHRPKEHKHYGEWSPARLEKWASSIGPKTTEVVKAIMSSKKHPEQGYRSSLGVIRLAKRYTSERVEMACERALKIGSPVYGTVKSMLKTGYDQEPLSEPHLELPPIHHENIRGAEYYEAKDINVN